MSIICTIIVLERLKRVDLCTTAIIEHLENGHSSSGKGEPHLERFHLTEWGIKEIKEGVGNARAPSLCVPADCL